MDDWIFENNTDDNVLPETKFVKKFRFPFFKPKSSSESKTLSAKNTTDLSTKNDKTTNGSTKETEKNGKAMRGIHSAIENLSSSQSDTFHLDPDNRFMIAFHLLVSFSIIATLILAPYAMFLNSTNNVFLALLSFSDIIFGIFVFMNFFTAYTSKGTKVRDKKSIISHYIFSMDLFLLDMLSFVYPLLSTVLPLDSERGRYSYLLKLTRYSALNRLVAAFEDNTESCWQYYYNLVQFFLNCMVPVHIFACAFFKLNSFGYHYKPDDVVVNRTRSDFAGTFLEESEDWLFTAFISEAEVLKSYIVCLYWSAITATSTGYGDITPKKDIINLSCILFYMFCSMILIQGIQLGKIASWFSNIDNSRARFSHRVAIINSHVKRMGVPKYLSRSVIGYYEYLWKRKRGRAENDMLCDIPVTMRSELAMVTNSFLVEKSRIIRELPIGLIRILALNVETRLYLPKQVVKAEGQIGDELFYILRGKLEILDTNNFVITILPTGRLIGETDLVISRPRPATMCAHTHAELLVLNRQDFRNCIKNFRKEYDKLKEVTWQMCMHAHSCAKRSFDLIESNDTRLASRSPPPTFSEEQAGELDKGQPFLIGNNPAELTGDLTDKSWSTFRHIHYNFVSEEKPRGSLDETEKSSKMQLLAVESPQMVSISSSSDGIMDHVIQFLWILRLFVYIRDGLRYMKSTYFYILYDVWINPQSRGYAIWSAFLLTCCIQIGIFPPLLFSFGNSKRIIKVMRSSAKKQDFYILSWIFGEFVFMIDIIIRLKLAIVTRGGILRSWRAVVIHYVSTFSFLLDCIAIIPANYIISRYYNIPISDYLPSGLRLLTLVKLFRCPSLFLSFENGPAGRLHLMVTVIKWYLLIILTNHWCACAFHAVVCIKNICYRDSWIEMWCNDHPLVCNSDENRSLIISYLLSFYFAVASMTSTGFGDIYARRPLTMILACNVVFIGLFTYGSCQAFISAYLVNLNEAEVNFRQYVHAVESFMKRRSLDDELQNRVIQYLDVIWQYFEGEWMPGQKSLLGDAPKALQKELAAENIAGTLATVPLFFGLHYSYLTSLSQRLHVYIFAPGDIISRANDVERVMFIVMRGWLGLYTNDHSTLLTKFGPHSHYGELTMMSGEPRPFNLSI